MSFTDVVVTVFGVCIIVIVFISHNPTVGDVEKAKATWIKHLKNELLRDRRHETNEKPHRKRAKPGQVNKGNAALTRGSMLGSVFSAMRWPELHGGGYLPQELECPTVNDLKIYNTSKGIPMGTVHRAMKTLPREFEVTWSGIPGAGMGVFATVFIRKYTWLAEYEGRLIEWTDNLTRTDNKKRLDRLNRMMDYGWVTSRFAVPKYLIDASRESYSNWLRYINMARRYSEENVLPVQCGDKFFYRTSKAIPPGRELLTNYGVDYMVKLGINREKYHEG